VTALAEEEAAVAELEDEELGPAYEFDGTFQRKIVALMLRDTTFAVRTHGLITPDYFENESDSAIAAVALDHFDRYKSAPSRGVLAHVMKNALANKLIHKDMWDDVKDRLKEVLVESLADRDLIIDEVAKFAKDRAVENAILQSAMLAPKKDYEKIRKIWDDALQVGANQEALGYDYWEEIEHRTEHRKAILSGAIVHDGITSGCLDLDNYLLPHKGWGRKELSVIMGAAKAGKSMSLGDFAKGASLAGYNVYYASCEVGRAIIADRTDANVSDVVVNLVGSSPSKVEIAVKAMAAKAGKLIIDEFATGSLKVSQLRRIVEGYRQKGIVFDLIVTDYADIMAPERHNNEERENTRQIYVDLRGLGFDFNAAMLTATQSNREGAKSAIVKSTDVSEDFNKIRTADIVLSINSTEGERLAGEARIFFAAVRNAEDGFILRIKQDRSRMQFIKSVIGKETLS